MIALEHMRAFSESHPPLPVQRVPVRRAEGWALRMRNAADAGRQLLEDAASMEDEMLGLAPQLAYDALRAGAPAAPQLQRMAARCQSRLVTAYAQHGSAKAARDGAALIEAAEEMATIGALRYAVEAATDAAVAFLSQGRQDSARRAAARARQLHVPDQGGELPPIDGLDATAVDLTRREAQLVELAREGLSNAEIADRLVTLGTDRRNAPLPWHAEARHQRSPGPLSRDSRSAAGAGPPQIRSALRRTGDLSAGTLSSDSELSRRPNGGRDPRRRGSHESGSRTPNSSLVSRSRSAPPTGRRPMWARRSPPPGGSPTATPIRG